MAAKSNTITIFRLYMVYHSHNFYFAALLPGSWNQISYIISSLSVVITIRWNGSVWITLPSMVDDLNVFVCYLLHTWPANKSPTWALSHFALIFLIGTSPLPNMMTSQVNWSTIFMLFLCTYNVDMFENMCAVCCTNNCSDWSTTAELFPLVSHCVTVTIGKLMRNCYNWSATPSCNTRF